MIQLPWRVIAWHFSIALFAVAAYAFFGRLILETPAFSERTPEHRTAQAAFLYEFSDDGILHESASIAESSSPYWWVDSGGKLIVENGVGTTLSGELSTRDAWRTRYARSSAVDTDDGAYPQNLFRMLTRSEWDDVRIESSFRVTAFNRTDSPNRNDSNGVLLMSRYRDGNNLYYAGLRVDGHAVIKKKFDGVYHTLAEKPVMEKVNNDVLPQDEWLTVRMETRTDGTDVIITMARKIDDTWEELLTVRDNGQFEDTPPIRGSYPVGIRTDFMDVEFDDFRAEEI